MLLGVLLPSQSSNVTKLAIIASTHPLTSNFTTMLIATILHI